MPKSPASLAGAPSRLQPTEPPATIGPFEAVVQPVIGVSASFLRARLMWKRLPIPRPRLLSANIPALARKSSRSSFTG